VFAVRVRQIASAAFLADRCTAASRLVFGSRWLELQVENLFDVIKVPSYGGFLVTKRLPQAPFGVDNNCRVSDASLVGLGQHHESSRIMSAPGAVVVAAIIIGTLYLGREVFVPIAMAFLLSLCSRRWLGCCRIGAVRGRYPPLASYSSRS
jgi:hypothetical protein